MADKINSADSSVTTINVQESTAKKSGNVKFGEKLRYGVAKVGEVAGSAALAIPGGGSAIIIPLPSSVRLKTHPATPLSWAVGEKSLAWPCMIGWRTCDRCSRLLFRRGSWPG